MAQTIVYSGLSDAEVIASRRKHGTNILTPPAREPLWKQFLAKFKDPLITVLLIAGVLSVGISCYEYFALGDDLTVFFEPIGIFVAILLATGMAFLFELKAEREFMVLNKVNDDEPVQVIRNGGVVTCVPRKDVVVGDIVVLNTGDEIPADADLLEATLLSVDESSLTGEPICSKTTIEADFDPEATFPSDKVLRGTKIMEGHGICRVVAVGDNTENGKVFEAARIDDGTKTPLTRQLDRLGRLISIASYSIAVAIVVGRFVAYFSALDAPFQWVPFLAYALQSVMIAVTLIVVAVPEGLPMAVTLSLAYSMRRMLKTNNLVRKMHACETMGATTVICTDKTGTLTRNRMQVSSTEFFELKDQKLTGDSVSRLVGQAIAVNSTAQLDLTDASRPQVLGNPTEGALLLWLRSQGVDYAAVRSEADVVDELPFSTERKYMATVVAGADGGRLLFVKGAPEIVMAQCSAIAGGVSRDMIAARLLDYQNHAMRALGFAVAELKPGETPFADGRLAVGSLSMIGIVAIADPVRDEVPAAVAECRDAGIAIKIVTGDTPGTAKEIGRQIGLWDDAVDGDRNIITGPEFAELSDDELHDRVMELKIIARARPLDKKRLVEALRDCNQVVAVTGDGTNDAPALKAAHVGLSMGDGTSVAKEASDITIIDNSFASIGRAVMWGRSLYKNIQRFILFQMTVNVVACLIVLVGAFLGTESPLTVTQMLWVNLIMDTFAAMALASLPPSESVMKEQPRHHNAFIITKPMANFIVGVGIVMFVLLFGLLQYMRHMPVDSLTDFRMADMLGNFCNFTKGHLSPYDLSLFFTMFVFLQFWNMFNARAFGSGRSALHLGGCSGFLFIAALILVGQIVIVSIGGALFGVVPLCVSDWLIIIGGTSVVMWLGELWRLLRR